MKYECIVCGRSGAPERPLRAADCETCGEPVCELCAPDHAAICAQARASFGSALGKL